MFTLTAKDAYFVIACDVTDGRQITGDVDPLSEEKSKKYIHVYTIELPICKTQLDTWGFMEFFLCPSHKLTAKTVCDLCLFPRSIVEQHTGAR